MNTPEAAAPPGTLDVVPFAEVEVGSHQLALLKDGAQAFPAMLRAIAEATSTVCLETYILRDDATGMRFAEALAERARAGVEVNLLYDAWGSSVSSAFVERLQAAGVRVVAYHPFSFSTRLPQIFGRFTRRNHRKALIVDGWTAFTGGLNISDDYSPVSAGGRGWRDTHLRLTGPAAAELEYFFARTWSRSRGAPLAEKRDAHAGRRPDPLVQVVSNDLRRSRHGPRDAYSAAIEGARRRVYLTTAYFLPTARLLRTLSNAARRGVDVQVIVAGTTDVPAVLLASRRIYGRLLGCGVRIFEWTGTVLHAKTAAIDGRWSTVGSMNLDHQSLRKNLEANAVIEDERFAAAVEEMFREDLTHCVEVTAGSWNTRPWWERAASVSAYLVRNWL